MQMLHALFEPKESFTAAANLRIIDDEYRVHLPIRSKASTRHKEAAKLVARCDDSKAACQ